MKGVARGIEECIECKEKYIVDDWWIGLASPPIVYR